MQGAILVHKIIISPDIYVSRSSGKVTSQENNLLTKIQVNPQGEASAASRNLITKIAMETL